MTALVVGCSDGHPCDLTQDESGAAVVSCPDGSSSRVLPGQDGDDVAERCEITTEDNLRWVVCGDLRAPLPTDEAFCFDGFSGDIAWPPQSSEDAMNLALFHEMGCTKVLGTLALIGGSVDEIPSWLLGVTEVGGLMTQNLFGAGELVFPNLTAVYGSLNVVGHSGVSRVEFPELREVEYLLVAMNPALERFSLPPLSSEVSWFEISENPVLTSIEVFGTWVGHLRLVDNPVIERITAHFEEGVDGMMISGPLRGNFTVDWQSPTQVSQLNIWIWRCGEDLWSAYLAETIPYSLTSRVNSPAVCY